MRKSWYYVWLSFFVIFLLQNVEIAGGGASNYQKNGSSLVVSSDTDSLIQNLYQSIDAEVYDLSFDAFRYAMLGYASIKAQNTLQNDKVITIIDFTKDSSEKRFYTIDLSAQKIVFNTLVSHGKNSGASFCTKFSNSIKSHQSSIGFYTTGSTYIGKHGESLRLHGNEKGYNSNAYKRDVVIHGADYVSESFIKKYGRLGRSHGCPALPMHLHKAVINTIKGGSLLFAYYDDANYLKTSKYLKNTNKVLLAQL